MVCWKKIAITVLFGACASHSVIAAECGDPPPKQIEIDLWSTRTLLSPDQQWQFTSVGPMSSERKAQLYIENFHRSKRWRVGSIWRDGTVFWSEDSKRLFLMDEYAADDTKIRVFDVTGEVPREIRGLDRVIRHSLFSRVPRDESTFWLIYPQVCFASNDSSTIIVVADAPLVRNVGYGPARPFGKKLTVDLRSLRVVNSEPATPK